MSLNCESFTSILIGFNDVFHIASLKFYLVSCPFNKVVWVCGRKSVDKIATQSMSKICNLGRVIVVDCDYAVQMIADTQAYLSVLELG